MKLGSTVGVRIRNDRRMVCGTLRFLDLVSDVAIVDVAGVLYRRELKRVYSAAAAKRAIGERVKRDARRRK